jgi:copper chaperone
MVGLFAELSAFRKRRKIEACTDWRGHTHSRCPASMLTQLSQYPLCRTEEIVMNTVTIKIEGMHCDGCASNVQSLLEHQMGVKKATASFQQKEARILYDPGSVSDDKLADIVEKAGYRVISRSDA